VRPGLSFVKREWQRERAFLAHYFPGLGDPIYLTLPEWDAMLGLVDEFIKMR